MTICLSKIGEMEQDDLEIVFSYPNSDLSLSIIKKVWYKSEIKEKKEEPIEIIDVGSFLEFDPLFIYTYDFQLPSSKNRRNRSYSFSFASKYTNQKMYYAIRHLIEQMRKHNLLTEGIIFKHREKISSSLQNQTDLKINDIKINPFDDVQKEKSEN